MKPTNCDRYGFTLGVKRHTYADLRHYVCNECGGGVTHRAVWDVEADKSVDKVACAQCGAEDLITESKYLRQISEAWEVESTLPEPYRTLLKGQRNANQG